MDNLTNLQRIVSSEKRISVNFYNLLVTNEILSQSLKHKIKLYFLQDKRLSLSGFQNDIIKEKKKTNKSGGLGFNFTKNRFIIDNKHVIVNGNVDNVNGQNAKVANVGKIMVEGKNITVNENSKIGEGSFADVYKIGDSDIVCKLYKKQSLLPFNFVANIENNIKDFVDTLPYMVQYTSFHGTDLVHIGERQGFLLKKMDGSLEALIQSDDIAKFLKCVDEAKEKLMIEHSGKYNFLHGDIKIENILHKISYNDTEVRLHDFDGVHTYDKATLMHKYEVPSKRNIYMTPLCAHPVFVKYIDALKSCNTLESLVKSLVTHVDGTSGGFVDVWGKYVSLTGSSLASEMAKHVLTILDHFYEDHGDFESYLKSLDKDQFTKYIKKQIALFDVYSLGISLLYHYIMLKKKNNNNTKIEVLYDKAYELMEMSLVKMNNNNNNNSNGLKGGKIKPKLDIVIADDADELKKLNMTVVVLPQTPKTPSGGRKLRLDLK
jgi:serine/threonine protein kinase